MTKKKFGGDIGSWTRLKLDLIRIYLNVYSNIIARAGYQDHYFVDAFAGEGICKCREDGKIIAGSSQIALQVDPPFTKYFFIELDKNKIASLEKIKENYTRLKIDLIKGDCNEKIDEVLPQINDAVPFVALLDPQAGDLFWETIEKISQKSKAEVLINFPFGMAISRYMVLTEGKDITKAQTEKLNMIFGNNKWKQIYEERKKKTISALKAREKYLDLYLNGLITTGFRYYAVKDIKNSLGNHIYYLIFGSKHLRGLEKMKEEFVKGETRRVTLFSEQELIEKIYRDFNNQGNLNLGVILEKLLPGRHLYRKQDFKDALVSLEKDGRLVRNTVRKRARSFQDGEMFKIV